MSKATIFAKNQIMAKSLGAYKPMLSHGDKLHMYNNVYKVLQCQDNGWTMLEDEKNLKLALPTNKIRMLMKKNLCRSLGAVNQEVSKAQLSGPSAKVGVTPKATNRAYADSSHGTPQAKGQPVGTVKVGGDGETYKKISADPAVWVKVATGSQHSDAGGDEQSPMSTSHETREEFQSMMSKIDSKVHPQDRKKIQDKAQEWLTETAKFKNMQAAHNTNEVDEKGAKLPKTGLSSSAMSKVFSQGDKARKVRQELIDMIKESRTRARGSNAK